jgi:hypothetical protein
MRLRRGWLAKPDAGQSAFIEQARSRTKTSVGLCLADLAAPYSGAMEQQAHRLAGATHSPYGDARFSAPCYLSDLSLGSIEAARGLAADTPVGSPCPLPQERRLGRVRAFHHCLRRSATNCWLAKRWQQGYQRATRRGFTWRARCRGHGRKGVPWRSRVLGTAQRLGYGDVRTDAGTGW